MSTDDAVITVYPKTKIESGPNIPNGGKINAGNQVTMECFVDNYYTWETEYQGKIEWKKDLTEINPDDPRYILEDNILTINNVTESDSGITFSPSSNEKVLKINVFT